MLGSLTCTQIQTWFKVCTQIPSREESHFHGHCRFWQIRCWWEGRTQIRLLQMHDIHPYKFLQGYYQSKLLLMTNRNKSCIFFGKEQHPFIMYSEHIWRWHTAALPEEGMIQQMLRMRQCCRFQVLLGSLSDCIQRKHQQQKLQYKCLGYTKEPIWIKLSFFRWDLLGWPGAISEVILMQKGSRANSAEQETTRGCAEEDLDSNKPQILGWAFHLFLIKHTHSLQETISETIFSCAPFSVGSPHWTSFCFY